jgi:hypothetical protein
LIQCDDDDDVGDGDDDGDDDDDLCPLASVTANLDLVGCISS